jgi:hypothetical protein
MISGGQIDAARLADVVALVARHRRPGAAPHPLNMLGPERALRARVVADPSLVGADTLVPVPPVVEPPDLRTATPAPAVGEDPGALRSWSSAPPGSTSTSCPPPPTPASGTGVAAPRGRRPAP